MKTKELFKLLENFTNRDWKEFKDFCKDRLSRERQEWVIVEYLYKYRGAERNNLYDLESLRSSLRPDLGRKAFQNLLYEFAKYVNQYLTNRELQSHKYFRNMLLLKSYKKGECSIYIIDSRVQ